LTVPDEQPRVFAVIPAAGQSRRFGAPKQLHAIDGTPILDHVLTAMVDSDVDAVVLVTRNEIWNELGDAWTSNVAVVFNEDPQAEMIDSVRLGISAVVEAFSPTATDGVLICPGDLPFIRADDVAKCLAAFRADPSRIVVAAHGDRRGHPLIFPASLVNAVRSPMCDDGLNRLCQEYSELVKQVSCDSPGVIRDIDTKDDLSGGANC